MTAAKPDSSTPANKIERKAVGSARYDRFMRGKWLLVGASVILVALAMGALTRLRHDASTKTSEIRKPPAESAPRELSLPGTIQAQHVVPVGAPVTGTIDTF